MYQSATLRQVKLMFPNAQSVGDLSFVEDLVPKNCELFHIDSYNHKEKDGTVKKRFQGVAIHSGKHKWSMDQMPVEVLIGSKAYSVSYQERTVITEYVNECDYYKEIVKLVVYTIHY
jgi:hypothetical protein